MVTFTEEILNGKLLFCVVIGFLKKDDTCTNPDVKTNIVNQKTNENLRTKNTPREKRIIVGDSIVKHAEV